jgi:hypothetical protein
MHYNYDDPSDPPDLETFKMDLIQTTLKKSFFQNEPPKPYKMLKLPIIMAPSLLRQQTNNDIKKKSLLEKEFVFTKETMTEFAKQIDSRKLNILSINDMRPNELVELAETLGLEKINQKSGTNLRNEINYLIKIFLAGQVPLLNCIL